MKKHIFSTAIAGAMIFSACGNSTTTKATTESFDTTKLKTGDAYYQCEMHPEVISDKPGSCSKCNMELVKMEKK